MIIYTGHYIILFPTDSNQQVCIIAQEGRLAQLVERTLCMREVGGSKPPMSILFILLK